MRCLSSLMNAIIHLHKYYYHSLHKWHYTNFHMTVSFCIRVLTVDITVHTKVCKPKIAATFMTGLWRNISYLHQILPRSGNFAAPACTDFYCCHVSRYVISGIVWSGLVTVNLLTSQFTSDVHVTGSRTVSQTQIQATLHPPPPPFFLSWKRLSLCGRTFHPTHVLSSETAQCGGRARKRRWRKNSSDQ